MPDAFNQGVVSALGGRLPIEVHPALLPAHGGDDRERKRFMSACWADRVPETHRAALETSLAGADRTVAADEDWRNLFWYVFVPPTASVHVYANRGVRWRVYGAGIPFYLEGRTDEAGYAKLFVGWATAFVSVDVLLGVNDFAQATLESFPSARPPRPAR